jgi:hypothetical protein
VWISLVGTKSDLAHIREEMATKEQLADVADRISNTKDDLQEQIAGLKYAREIDESPTNSSTFGQTSGNRAAM